MLLLFGTKKMEIYKQTILTKMTHSTLKSAWFIMTPMIRFMDYESLNSSMNTVDPVKDV